MEHHDFLIEKHAEIDGIISAAGIDSPGLASAPAVAGQVVEILRTNGEKLEEKKDWEPRLAPRPGFRTMSDEERARLVEKNPLYGRIVCRCENVTEGEILDAVNAPVPARTYDALKRRTWLGTGRCQGSFDYPHIIRILSESTGQPVEKVTKKGRGSEFIFSRTK